LPPEETVRYIAHRLKLAGFPGQTLFTAEALAMIVGWSRGIPREINRLCFNSLSLGCALGKHEIDAEILREVTTDLDFVEEASTKVAVGALDARAPELAAQFRGALGAAPAVLKPISLAQRDSEQFANALTRDRHRRITFLPGQRTGSLGTYGAAAVAESDTLSRTPRLQRASQHQPTRASAQNLLANEDTGQKKEAWKALSPAAQACYRVAGARPALIGLLMLPAVLGLWFLLGGVGASGRVTIWLMNELRSQRAASARQSAQASARARHQEDTAAPTTAKESAQQH
jgi:hypothetical protein